MSTPQLWEITRGGWTFRRRDDYKYAFCVHEGIVRGVWRITGWDEDDSHWGKGRRALLGEVPNPCGVITLASSLGRTYHSRAASFRTRCCAE
jgi:hypothetical protein